MKHSLMLGYLGYQFFGFFYLLLTVFNLTFRLTVHFFCRVKKLFYAIHVPVVSECHCMHAGTLTLVDEVRYL